MKGRLLRPARRQPRRALSMRDDAAGVWVLFGSPRPSGPQHGSPPGYFRAMAYLVVPTCVSLTCPWGRQFARFLHRHGIAFDTVSW